MEWRVREQLRVYVGELTTYIHDFDETIPDDNVGYWNSEKL